MTAAPVIVGGALLVVDLSTQAIWIACGTLDE